MLEYGASATGITHKQQFAFILKLDILPVIKLLITCIDCTCCIFPATYDDNVFKILVKYNVSATNPIIGNSVEVSANTKLRSEFTNVNLLVILLYVTVKFAIF